MLFQGEELCFALFKVCFVGIRPQSKFFFSLFGPVFFTRHIVRAKVERAVSVLIALGQCLVFTVPMDKLPP